MTSQASISSTQNSNNLTGATVATAIGFRPSKEESTGRPAFFGLLSAIKRPFDRKTKEEVSVKRSSRPVSIPPLHYIRCFFSYHLL